MIDPLQAASRLAAGGLEAQATRLRVVSENVANVRSTGATGGADPYSRKTVTFETVFDREIGASAVRIKQVGVDDAPFTIEHDPGNPAADDNGNVKLPNVNMLIELADMREASRTYEANLQMMKQTRSMVAMTIDLLRSQG
jgi:flagellar basal-body rod protein FlgC